MTDKYRIVESVGSRVEVVHEYSDLEKHHPSSKENPARRNYGEIDGRREEFVYTGDKQRMVSKDFVLQVNGSGNNVKVPSPVEGYIKRSPAMDRWGTVEIYDSPDGKGNLIARIRHMDPISVKDGDRIEYGQPLGIQGRAAPPGTQGIGLHVHMDFNEAHLDGFKQYIRDVDRGVITPNRYPAQQEVAAPDARATSGSDRKPEPPTHGAGNHGLSDEDVRKIQASLNELGVRDAHGRELKVDGDYGRNTRAAVEAFQREHGLKLVDGIVGPETQGKLHEALQAQSQAQSSPGQITQPTASGPRLGSCGVGVETLQQQLNQAGIQTPVDGIFNHRMEGALKDYQQVQNLPVTGLADTQTMAQLGQQQSQAFTQARIDQQGHPGYPLFSQAQGCMNQLCHEQGKAPDVFSTQAAGAIAAYVHVHGFNSVNKVVLSDDRSQLFAVQGDVASPTARFAQLPATQALNQSLEQSTEQWNKAQQQAQSTQQAEPQQQQMPAGMSR